MYARKKLPGVKTTLVMLPETMKTLRQVAATEERTISEVLGDAVRIYVLDFEKRKNREFTFPTFSGLGMRPGVDPKSNVEMLEAE